MLASPLPIADIFLGHLMLMTLRVTLGAVAFGVAAAALGHGSLGLFLAVPAAVLVGAAFAAPVSAWAVGRQSDSAFSMVFRVAIMPMFLFSGTFFPVSSLPAPLEAAAVVTPLWHGVELCRGLVLDDLSLQRAGVHVGYLVALLTLGLVAGRRTYAKALTR
jgi:lipooligosaccharide transport system permease protein